MYIRTFAFLFVVALAYYFLRITFVPSMSIYRTGREANDDLNDELLLSETDGDDLLVDLGTEDSALSSATTAVEDTDSYRSVSNNQTQSPTGTKLSVTSTTAKREQSVQTRSPTQAPVGRRKTAKDIADEQVGDFLSRLRAFQSKGPIIAGGLGDSGTRGVHQALTRLGANMLNDRYNKDSQLFINSYPTVNSKGEVKLKSPPKLYSPLLSKSQTLNYNSKVLSEDSWETGRQYVAQMLNTTMYAAWSDHNGSDVSLDPFGFKHPRASLLVPFFLDVLGDNFVFVHVIRDMKEVIWGDNQQFVTYMCVMLLKKNCDKDTDLFLKAKAWARFNREVFEFAMRSSMKAHQYIVVRIEDLVLRNEPCLARLRHYLNQNISDDQIKEKLQLALDSAKGHETSYFGYQLGNANRHETEMLITNDTNLVHESMFWGYYPDRFELSRDCESLPWMEEFRKAKGPLPGDGQIANSSFSSAPWDVLRRGENMRPYNITRK